jgi:hypothetical protein
MSIEMSVVVVTPDDFETVRRTVRHLVAQTARERLELVLVAPSLARLGPDPDLLAAFPRVELVEIGPLPAVPPARAAGVRRASAPLVALVEDHSYPRPGWAEALIAAHRGPWAAVGPAMGNANPASPLGWANLLIDYGPWLDPAAAGPHDHLPGHNSSYKRALLLPHDAFLETLLEAESVLHWELRARGHRLYLESAAVSDHLNATLLGASLALRFHGGRQFAAARAREGRWTPLRRLLYGGGAPLIPLVRLRRLLDEMRRRPWGPALLPRVLPPLMVLLAADAAGELVGYVWGGGDVVRRMVPFEVHRERLLDARERRAVAG